MRKTISRFFSWMSDEGHISYNPAKALKRIKYTKTVKKPFSIVEREKLKNTCINRRDLALVEFLYASGLRVSEAISIDISNIDFISREATNLTGYGFFITIKYVKILNYNKIKHIMFKVEFVFLHFEHLFDLI